MLTMKHTHGKAGGKTAPPDSTAHNELTLLQEKYARLLADVENVRRQAREERALYLQTAARDVLSDLLPTLDHLQLALQHFPDPSLKMIVAGLMKVCQQHGLQALEPVGQPFDPHTMEAIESVPGAKDQVVAVLQTGYTLGSSPSGSPLVLRPAKVSVGNGTNQTTNKEDL